MTSQVRSSKEYLIPTYSILMLLIRHYFYLLFGAHVMCGCVLWWRWLWRVGTNVRCPCGVVRGTLMTETSFALDFRTAAFCCLTSAICRSRRWPSITSLDLRGLRSSLSSTCQLQRHLRTLWGWSVLSICRWTGWFQCTVELNGSVRKMNQIRSGQKCINVSISTVSSFLN